MQSTEQYPQIDRSSTLERIQQVELPATVEEIAEEYRERIGDRSDFLWRWLYLSFTDVTLDSVPDEYLETVWEQKTIAAVYVALLDDLAESRDDHVTFKEAAKIPFEQQHVNDAADGIDRDYLQFTQRVWERVEEGIKDAPRYDEFREILEFDLRQTLNAMDYARLVNQNIDMANMTETRGYGAHNMAFFVALDMDLMYSPAFDRSELGQVRELVWDAQEVARIGNWITTWQREVLEDDFAAGIFVYALDQGILTPDQLTRARNGNGDAGKIAATIDNHNIEGVFVDDWKTRYEDLLDTATDITTVNMAPYVEGVEQMFHNQLAGRGQK